MGLRVIRACEGQQAPTNKSVDVIVLFPPHGQARAPLGHDHFGVRLEIFPRTQARAVQWWSGAAKRDIERAGVEEYDESGERRQYLADAGSL